MEIKIRKARISFPCLFTPKKVNESDPNAKPRYSCSLLLPKDDPQVKTLRDMIEKLAHEKWTDAKEFTANWNMLNKKDLLCIHDGEDKAAQYAGYEGCDFISAAATVKPGVYHNVRDPQTGKAMELTEDSGVIYSGCYVNAKLDVYIQDNSFGKRAVAKLLGVQFAGDGDAFSSRPPAKADDFDDDLADQGQDNADML